MVKYEITTKMCTKSTYGNLYIVRKSKNQPENTKNIFCMKKPKKIFKKHRYPFIRKEIDILEEIDSKYVVEILHSNYFAKTPYFIMPLYDCNLFYAIHNHYYVIENNIVNIMKKCLIGLKDIHNCGVIHGDIKPSNIVLDISNKNIKYIDFGNSIYEDSQEENDFEITCTSNYRAPEIFLGQKFHTYNFDIWSLGCIFSELITKKVLFSGNKSEVIKKKIFNMIGCCDTKYLKSLPLYNKKKKYLYKQESILKNYLKINNKFIHIKKDLIIDLICSMLKPDPTKRPTEEELLQNSLFSE